MHGFPYKFCRVVTLWQLQIIAKRKTRFDISAAAFDMNPESWTKNFRGLL